MNDKEIIESYKTIIESQRTTIESLNNVIIAQAKYIQEIATVDTVMSIGKWKRTN